MWIVELVLWVCVRIGRMLFLNRLNGVLLWKKKVLCVVSVFVIVYNR